MGWLNALFAEAKVIADAPLLFGFACVAIFFISLKISNAWNKRELDILKAKDSLNKADIDSLKAQNKNLLEKISGGASSREYGRIAAVATANNAVQAMYTNVTSLPAVAPVLSTHPTDSKVWKPDIWRLSPQEFEEIAAARRLVESGWAAVGEGPTPGTYTLHATAKGMEMRKLFDQVAVTKPPDVDGKKP